MQFHDIWRAVVKRDHLAAVFIATCRVEIDAIDLIAYCQEMLSVIVNYFNILIQDLEVMLCNLAQFLLHLHVECLVKIIRKKSRIDAHAASEIH